MERRKYQRDALERMFEVETGGRRVNRTKPILRIEMIALTVTNVILFTLYFV